MARQLGPQRDVELHVFYIVQQEEQHARIDLVEHVLALPGVVRAEWNIASGRFIVLGNVDRERIEDRLREAGITVEREKTSPPSWWQRLKIKLAERGKRTFHIIMILFLIGFLGGGVASLPGHWRITGIVGTMVFIGGLLLFFHKVLPKTHTYASKRVIMQRMEMGVLFFVTCVAIAVGQAWPTTLFVIACMIVSVVVPRLGFRYVYKRIGEPQNNLTSVGHIVNDGEDQTTKEVDINRIAPGDTVQWTSGDVTAVDGYVIQGRAKVHERYVNGETIPFMCGEGQFLPAGATIIEGTVHVRVIKSAATSMARLIHQPKLLHTLYNDLSQRPLTRLLPHITTALIYVALAFLVIPPFFLSESVGPWLTHATLILLVAPMHIVTTALYAPALATQTRISALGGVIRSIHTVIRLGRANRVVCSPSLLLDGRHTVSDVKMFGNMTLQDTLYVAATACAGMKTPFAKALKRAAREQGVDTARPTRRTVGESMGVKAKVVLHGQVRNVLIGNTRWLKQHDITIPHEELIDEAARQSAYVVWLVVEGEPEAAFFIYARVRDGSSRFVQRLHNAGIQHITLLATEELPYIQRLAEQAGIKHFFSLSPQQQEKKIATWQRQKYSTASAGLHYDSHCIRKAHHVHVTLYNPDVDEDNNNERTIRIVSSDTGKIFTVITLARKMNQVAGLSLFIACTVKVGLIIAAILGRPALWHVAAVEAFFVVMFVVYSTAILRHRR